MGYVCGRLWILGLVILLNGAQLALGSDPPLPQPVSTIDTSELLPNHRDLTFTTVAFLSDTTIEVVTCPTVSHGSSCFFSVFRWENESLKHVAEPPKLDTGASASSADGKRALVDFNDRKVSRPQHLLDNVRAGWTFGMIYPEEVNREVVQVVDTATRKSCFDWRTTFPMTYARRKSAAFSPSGEIVAIKVENNLSVYRLPSVCEGPKVTRRVK
jgi:hypothetical protein